VLVTGKGPQKQFFDQVFRERNGKYRMVNIQQVWVHADDYPAVVASADLGVCLHTSSSGFDLPMKVVDMFSAGVPCLAIGGYPSLPELVKDGVNGLVFESSEQLAE
jgi:beta-1,4-mannosyltransferase